MKKIYSLIVGALLVGMYTMLGSTVFALLMPQSHLSTFLFQTAQLDLLVASSSGGPFTHQLSLATDSMLLADDTEHSTDFWVKNASSNTIDFQLSGQLSTGDQDWDVLKKAIEINISNFSDESGWKTLEEWTNSSVDFPGQLESGTTRRYRFLYRLPSTYSYDPDGEGPIQIGDAIGEELEGKVTTGMTFTISGEIL